MQKATAARHNGTDQQMAPKKKAGHTSVVVTNIDKDVELQHLRELFQSLGKVTSLKLGKGDERYCLATFSEAVR